MHRNLVALLLSVYVHPFRPQKLLFNSLIRRLLKTDSGAEEKSPAPPGAFDSCDNNYFSEPGATPPPMIGRPGRNRHRLRAASAYVSILVLLDRAAGHVDSGRPTGADPRVSILVLLDRAAGQRDEASRSLLTSLFQSLFSWIGRPGIA
jgi:hypothetical protein